MSIRPFLDVSTSHLSPEARRWLSESATLNHAANYHGTGGGAALGTLGATLYGWFMHAPDLPETGGIDNGIPDDLHPVIRLAHSFGCHAILFDADGDIYDGIPVYDDETGEA